MKDKKTNYVLYFIGGIMIVWVALLIAPNINKGLIEIIKNLPNTFNNPFHIEICENSLKTIFIFLSIYILGIGVYLSTRRHYRRGEEYGSAIWGIPKQINKKYMQKPKEQNKILTQNINIGLIGKKHREKFKYFSLWRKWCRKNKIFCKT